MYIVRTSHGLRVALGLIAAAALSACGGGAGSAASSGTPNDPAGAQAAAGRRLAMATSGPAWTMIAWENESFSVSGSRQVRYGANASWVTKTISGSAPCTNAFFGSDPAVGTGKQCEVDTSAAVATAEDTSTWTAVAWENQSFSITGTQTVRYGADASWITKSVSGSAECSNAFFGSDPAYGIAKQCQVASGGTEVAPPASSTPVTSAARSGVGMNLDMPTYWQSDWPYINELKRAGGWSTRCESWATPDTCKDFANGASANDTLEQDEVAWDANGYALRLPAADDPAVKYRQLAALLFQGNGGSHPAGRWVVLYDGDGTIAYAGAGRKIDDESQPGRDVLDVTNAPGEGLALRITRINEADHLRNIRVIGPGGVCADAPQAWVPDAGRCAAGVAYSSLEALSATQTFHPAYVGDLSGFRALRFMKWSAANTARLTSWSSRPLLADALWNREAGVPYEAMFELSRITGADPWINVPPFVDDDFARQLARLARRSLAPGATLYFEYGNEPWNQAPPYSDAGVMFEARAAAQWPDATMPMWQQRLNWYAYRSVQLCRIIKQEFGAESPRVKCMANSQAANTDVSNTILACELARAELGSACGRQLDGLAIAPYFGYYMSDGQFAATIDAWTREPDGGLDKIFRELTGRDAAGNAVTPPLYTGGGWTPRDGALAEAQRWMAASRSVADGYGIPLVAYEAGQHLQTYGGGATEALFRAANRDPRMGAAMQEMAEGWKAAGGELVVPFSYTQLAAMGSAWGMKEHQRDDSAPKWLAIKAARDGGCWWNGCR